MVDRMTDHPVLVCKYRDAQALQEKLAKKAALKEGKEGQK